MGAGAGGGAAAGVAAGPVPASVRNLARRLRRAGLPWRVEEFLALQAAAAAVGGGLLVLAGRTWWWGLGGAAAGWWAPQAYVQMRQARRLARCAADLPAALGMMSQALKAGHSFLQAAETVAEELDSPLAEEFGQMVHEIRLNVSTEDALANLVDRVRSDDLDLVVTAVLIQRQVGGNLAQLLDQIAHTIRERVRIQGEVRVLTSQGRLSGWIVGALPVALLVLVSLMNPGYLAPLFHTPLGRALLGTAAVMEALGAFVIHRIVRIEV
ncbi:MAG: type II secretion system F family protein [Firmicutes bacterium]|nr:type II secretion system F family protein [Bacillota bacterium]